MWRLLLWASLTLSLATTGLRAQIETGSARSEAVIEQDFLKGLTALETGKPAEAIPVFTRILASDPDLIRVRLELARAYFLAEQWNRARAEFFTALSADLPEPVKNTILQFIREIDARRGFDWDLSIATVRLGDTRSYRSDTILVDFGGITLPFTFDRNDKTEIGLDVDAIATLRRPLPALSGTRTLTTGFLSGRVSGDLARSRELRDLEATLRSGLRFSSARSTWSTALVYRDRYVSDDRYEQRAGIQISGEYRTAEGFSLFGAAEAVRIDNAVSDQLDGDEVALRFGARRSLGGRAVLGAAVMHTSRWAGTGFTEARKDGVQVFGRYDAAFGLTFDGSITLDRIHYPDPGDLLAEDPDQTRLSMVLEVEKPDLILSGGFIPFFRASATRADSPAKAFSYTEHAVSVGLRRLF